MLQLASAVRLRVLLAPDPLSAQRPGRTRITRRLSSRIQDQQVPRNAANPTMIIVPAAPLLYFVGAILLVKVTSVVLVLMFIFGR